MVRSFGFRVAGLESGIASSSSSVARSQVTKVAPFLPYAIERCHEDAMKMNANSVFVSLAGRSFGAAGRVARAMILYYIIMLPPSCSNGSSIKR